MAARAAAGLTNPHSSRSHTEPALIGRMVGLDSALLGALTRHMSGYICYAWRLSASQLTANPQRRLLYIELILPLPPKLTALHSERKTVSSRNTHRVSTRPLPHPPSPRWPRRGMVHLGLPIVFGRRHLQAFSCSGAALCRRGI